MDVLQKLIHAKLYTDIFPTLSEPRDSWLSTCRKQYHEYAKATHPDVCNDDRAEDAFKQLNTLWVTVERLALGMGLGTIQHGTSTYTLNSILYHGEITDCYLTTIHNGSDLDRSCVLKLPHAIQDNDLMAAEAVALRRIMEDSLYLRYAAYVPALIDTFYYRDAMKRTRAVHVQDIEPGFYSLADVLEAYPDGIPAEDIAWIFRRLLIACGLAHHAGIVIGGVLPSMVYIHPEKHGLIIHDFPYAQSNGSPMRAISQQYSGFYPWEFVDTSPANKASYSLDLYMAASCMHKLMYHTASWADRRLRDFFKGCMLSSAYQRPSDAWALLEEFESLISEVWGGRKFHVFVMPETVGSAAK